MDSTDQIKKLIASGDYYLALGVDPGASRLDIEVTSARTIDDHSELAATLGWVTQVITDPEKHKIYGIACRFRDAVLRSLDGRYGDDFSLVVPKCQVVAWIECQNLLRCNFEKGDIKIGPTAAASLATHGLEWIMEAVVNNRLSVIRCDEYERKVGAATRIIALVNCPDCGTSRWLSCAECGGSGRLAPDTVEPTVLVLADDFRAGDFEYLDKGEECPQCEGAGSLPCDCSDEYTFRVPRDAAAGAVLHGRGNRTGKSCYVLLERPTVTVRPYFTLFAIYHTYSINKQFPALEADMTFEEAEAYIAIGYIVWFSGLIVCGAVIGSFFGSWWVGALTGLPLSVVSLVNRQFFFRPNLQKALILSAVGMMPVVGMLAGYFIASWKSGLAIGGTLSVFMLVVSLVFLRIARAVM